MPHPATQNNDMAPARPTNMTRVLHAARQLVIDRGARKVSIAEIAHNAGVGKGTIYLYWNSKEDLIISLMADEVAVLLHDLAQQIRNDATIVQPSTLAGLVVQTNRANQLVTVLATDPLVMRMQTEGMMADPVIRASSPLAICEGLVPILREHHLVRDDLELDVLSYGLHCLVAGEMAHLASPELAGGISEHHRHRLFRSAVAALLGERQQPLDHCEATAHDISALLTSWSAELSAYRQPQPIR